MVMLRVGDPTVRAMLLSHLIEQVERGELSQLLDRGVTPSMMDRLRSLTASDVLHLATSGHPDVHFTLDVSGFELGVNTLNRRKAVMQELAYFIQNGASHSMLAQFFPSIDPEVVKNLREVLRPERRCGRASLPDDGIRDKVHEKWHEILRSNSEQTACSRLVALHGHFHDIPLDALYATVNEFGDDHGR